MVKVRGFRAATGVFVAAGVLAALAVLPAGMAGAASSAADDDVAAAEAGTIQQSDVPTDFTESTPMESQAGPPPSGADSEDDLSQQVKAIPDCKAFVKVFQPTSKAVTASADGGSFDKQQVLGGANMSSSTLVFTSTATAKKFFLPFKAPKLATCLDQAMKASIEESMSAGGDSEGVFSKFDSSIEKRAVPKMGDETVDYRITFDIGTDESAGASFSMKMYMDMEFVRTGRGIGAYLTMSTGTPDDATSQAAIEPAVARFTTALG